MGIKVGSLKLLSAHCPLSCRPGETRRICELGNQHLKYTDPGLAQYLFEMGLPVDLQTGKQVFEKLGWLHVSIDLNGKDGAVPMDLSGQIDVPGWNGSFDVVTNFGTTEHVPFQYGCFKNIHDLTKNGGLMVHVISAKPDHGSWNYSASFFLRLASLNDYEVVVSPEVRPHVREGHVSCVLRRVNAEPFCSKGDFPGPLRVGDFNKYLSIKERASC
jgi:hypothetical protein